MLDLEMPNFYVPPLAIPLNYRNDVTGQLPAVVKTFIFFAGGMPNAPCWMPVNDNPEDDFTDARRQPTKVGTLKTPPICHSIGAANISPEPTA